MVYSSKSTTSKGRITMKVSYATIGANKTLFLLKMIEKYGPMKKGAIITHAIKELECYISPGTVYGGIKNLIISGDIIETSKGKVGITDQGRAYLEDYILDLELFITWVTGNRQKAVKKFHPTL